MFKYSILISTVILFGCSPLRRWPQPDEVSQTGLLTLTVEYIKNNQLYTTNEDTVNLAFNKMITDTYFIDSIQNPVAMHFIKTLFNINNWDIIGVYSYDTSFTFCRIFMFPKQRLFWIREPVEFHFSEGWLNILYVEEQTIRNYKYLVNEGVEK